MTNKTRNKQNEFQSSIGSQNEQNECQNEQYEFENKQNEFQNEQSESLKVRIGSGSQID